jgi:hypothetical protein
MFDSQARYEMIKVAAEKLAFRKKIRNKSSIALRLRKAVKWSEEGMTKKELDSQYNDRAISKMDDNHNQWTDSAAYAKKHYGDIHSETTKFDNDWD